MNRCIRGGLMAAFALVPVIAAHASETSTVGNSLFISGTARVDAMLLRAFLDPAIGICEDNPLDGDPFPANDDAATVIFADGASVTDPVNFVVYCRVKAGQFGIGGNTIKAAKYSGGSETAFAPVASQNQLILPGQPVLFADASGPCSAATAGPGSGTTFIRYQIRTNCGLGAAASSDGPRFGLALMDQRFWNASLSGTADFGHAFDAIYAPVVSRNFYAALQAAQGLTGTRSVYRGPGADGLAGTADDVTASITCDDNATTDEACLPTLPTAVLRGIYSGKESVSDMRINGVTIAAPAGGTQIRICRRGDNSGTQRAFERQFFEQVCNTFSNLAFARDAVVQGGTCANVGCAFADANIGTTGIFQGKLVGDVEACLDDAVADGVYAVGVMTADRIPDNAAKEFRYIKLDGVAPLMQNVIDGRYSFFTEGMVVTGSPLTTVQGGIANALKTHFRTAARYPQELTNTGIATNGVAVPNAGLLLRPTATIPPASPPVNYFIRPVATQIRNATIGGTAPVINNCTPPAFVQGTDFPIMPSSLTAP